MASAVPLCDPGCNVSWRYRSAPAQPDGTNETRLKAANSMAQAEGLGTVLKSTKGTKLHGMALDKCATFML